MEQVGIDGNESVIFRREPKKFKIYFEFLFSIRNDRRRFKRITGLDINTISML